MKNLQLFSIAALFTGLVACGEQDSNSQADSESLRSAPQSLTFEGKADIPSWILHQANQNLNCGGSVSGKFKSWNSAHSFSFAGQKGQKATFTFKANYPNWRGANLAVYDASSGDLLAKAKAPSKSVALEYIFPASKKYIVAAFSSTWKAWGKYKLTAECESLGCKSSSECAEDEYCTAGPCTNYCDGDETDCCPLGECVPEPTCDDVECPDSHHCELQQVYCITTPCPAIATCVEDLTCESVEEAHETELAMIQGCQEDAECGQVLTGTSCGCTRNLVARNDADTSEFYNLMQQSQDMGCSTGGISTCDCPATDGFKCDTGTCTWNYSTGYQCPSPGAQCEAICDPNADELNVPAGCPIVSCNCEVPACATNDDCDGGWCSPTQAGEMECKDYAQAGDFCGGFTPVWGQSICDPSLKCFDHHSDFIADAPGKCVTEATAADIMANPSAYAGLTVGFRGWLGASIAMCTKMACSPANPCCNSCGSSMVFTDEPGVDTNFEGLGLKGVDGNLYGCSGNECTYQDNCTAAPGKYKVVGQVVVEQYQTYIQVQHIENSDY